MTATFSGTRRFRALRKLGEGGMGAVYECEDLQSQGRVALKTLLYASASALLAFKDEFRQFQGIHHPNLVSLGELFEEDGMWHFTMELVDGRDFIASVRQKTGQLYLPPDAETLFLVEPPVSSPAPSPDRAVPDNSPRLERFDDSALRSSLGQLGRALSALHDAGKVHRDVKPSNILVTREGRTVLLDFGVGTDSARLEQCGPREIVGTPHYMAPEQAAGLPVSASADFYAVGAMLYEALTGALPFDGTLLQIIENKQRSAPSDPREISPDVPDDLASLAVDLLATEATNRPSGAEFLRRLGLRQSVRPAPHTSITHADNQGSSFVGRESELAALEACLAQVCARSEAIAAYVRGESGIGKSALVRTFAERLQATDRSTVVLSGACYEHEAVPYKAVDGVVDALSRFLAKLPPTAAARLLPRHAASLAQAFPVLGRVEAFAECPVPRTDIDPLEQRSRVFGALRELLTRLADRGRLVVCIDDLQWADADSIALLSEILRGPGSPALLLVATVRTSESTPPPALPVADSTPLPATGTGVDVGRLPTEHARELVSALARRVGALTNTSFIDEDSIVREAHGYPLFLNELVRYHATNTSAANHAVGIDDALWSRIEGLDENARRLLQVTALAPAAIMQGTAARAADIETVDAAKIIKQLKVAHLVTTTGGTRMSDLIEPHHGRIREAVRTRLAPEERKALHRRLALTMETSGLHEHEQLAVHWREAGDPERAAEAARRAAARAEDALAFDRAVTYYRMVDELVELDPRERRTLLVRQGNALANAGRSQEAAQLFREASIGAGPLESRELARRAAEHLLRSGHIGEGLAELRRVLTAVDVPYPETTSSAIASMLWSRAKLSLRGLAFEPVERGEVSPSLLAQIDACWAATTGLFVVDQLRGVSFQYRHLLLALRAGEPERIIRGLAFHAIATSAGGQDKIPEARSILELANHHATIHGTPYLRGLLAYSAGTVAYLSGSFGPSIAHGQEAIELLRSTCRSVAWELASARQNVFWSLAFAGKLEELTRLTRATLRETLEAGDHYAAMGIRSGLPNATWLAEDDPIAARREADGSIAAWLGGNAFLQHLIDLVAQTGIDLYEGQNARAFERVARARTLLEDAGLLRVELNRILFLDVASRAALAAARDAAPEHRSRLLAAARQDMTALTREQAPWARALGEQRKAALESLTGHPDAHHTARRALAALVAQNLGLYAASLSEALNLESPGTGSRTLLATTVVKRPDIFARVFAPGF